MNKLISSIAAACKRLPIEEKWLVAPSRRVGRQWLDTLARAGSPAINVHVKTLSGIALDVAAPVTAKNRTTLISPTAAQLIVAAQWEKIAADSGANGYLSKSPVNLDFTNALLRTINAIRLAGLRPDDLRNSSFEVSAKHREITKLLELYISELRNRRLIDYAGAMKIAARSLSESPDAIPPGVFILFPNGHNFQALEKRFVDAISSKIFIKLEIDDPANPAKIEAVASDIELLTCITTPEDAPVPAGDSSVRFFRSAGRMNEVLRVLRTCIAENIPFDDVEILHPGSADYVSMIYQAALKYNSSSDYAPLIGLTFAEGIPTALTRPGRALSVWINWVRSGYGKKTLVNAIRDNLFCMQDNKAPSGARLARRLRDIKLPPDKDRYLAAIDKRISFLEQLEQSNSSKNKFEIDDMNALRTLTEKIISCCPAPGAGDREVLECAGYFIREVAGGANEMDNYASVRILAEIDTLIECLDRKMPESALDIWKRLEEFPGGLSVAGSAPRPGHIHVDSIFSGGHSGRKHVFIIGLDDGSFPGTQTQDPLLLDNERLSISTHLQLSGGVLEEKIKEFHRLLARLRGKVYFGYSCLDPAESSEMFPASILLDIYRVVSGDRDGDQDSFDRLAGPANSFAADSPDMLLDIPDWWLLNATGEKIIKNARNILFDMQPHLASGFNAELMRGTDIFTKFDGLVPLAGSDNNPFATDPIYKVSPSRLEKAGTCPRRFFFNYALGIDQPEDLESDPGVWLDPLMLGSLMHLVFERFYRRVGMEENRAPVASDETILNSILDEAIAETRSFEPPPSEAAYLSRVNFMREMAHVFLQEEIRFSNTSKPMYMEAAFGVPPDGGGTPIDVREPLPIDLPGGERIHAAGRVDRIDQLKGRANAFAIWDYKTGGDYKYRETQNGDPFHEGRVVQHTMYMLMVEPILKKHHGADAVLAFFGYFFPSPKQRGNRITFEEEYLTGGANVVARICRNIAQGCFTATNEKGDCTYCDFISICGDPESIAAATKEKMKNNDNTAMKHFRELRNA